MTAVNKYRIYCNTESAYVYQWAESAPSVCPNNTGHTIDSSKTAAVATIGDGYPTNSEGKPIFVPVIHHDKARFIHAGVADDITNGTRWGGDLFEKSRTDQGDATMEWQYMEWTRIAGAIITASGFANGDYLKCELIAPSSAGAATSNPGAGDYDKVEIIPSSGLYMFVPTTPDTGDWDLDLSAKINANVDITKATPVPADDNDGYFDYDKDTGVVSVNTAGEGAYNLFDFQMTMFNIIPKIPIPKTGELHLNPPNVRPMLCLPHWKFKATIHRETGGTIDVNWYFVMEREEA